MGVSAVFLDRDGTIIEDVGYVDDPGKVRLLPRAAEAIRRFTQAGHRVVVISNQSGIARGLFDEETLSRVHERLEALLREAGARLDGAYYCPYLDGPEAKVEAYRRDSELRKPRPGMLRQAAEELGIDLAKSWMIGDSVRDVQAGREAGCRTVLIANPEAVDAAIPGDTARVASLWEAANLVVPDPVPTGTASPPVGRRAGGDLNQEGEILRLLAGIHEQIDRALRPRRQHDFSMLRLMGALLQMFAIVGGVWGAVALLNDQHVAATGRLLLACFFQLASLSAFAIDRFR